MRIDRIHIKNFRGFEDIEIPLDSKFNLIIGDNGSGKTAVLEALTVAMGSFFLGIRNTDSRHIRQSDVRVVANEISEEYRLPVVIKSLGLVNGNNITWSRELNSFESGTSMLGAKSIIDVAKHLEESLSEPIIMPVLAYYSTGRLWNNLIERKTKKEVKRPVASRLRAYKSCLQAKSTFKIFLQWYKGKEQSAIQRKEEDTSLRVIKKLIAENLPNCKTIFYEFDEDKIQGLKLEMLDGKTLPFEYLSDGTRNLFALLSDIAYKCLVLNPHLRDNALSETPGIILIDELDLHLHPDWQKQIVKSLKSAFGNIQFVTTSHSPFLIQEMAEGQLLKLKENQVLVTGADQLSIEDIAQYEQEVENPQWSEKKKALFKAAEEYYSALETGQVTEDLEIKMSELIRPFSQNQAYDAYMQQVKLTKQKKDEAGN